MSKIKELVDVCKESVYKTLFLKYSEGIRNFIYARSGDLVLAEDIVQDSFLKLWEICKTIIFSKSKAFLFTTANNLFIDTTRRKKVALSYKSTQDANPSDIKDPQYHLEMLEFKDKLEDIIDSMPQKSREVFLMSRIEKLKYKEIAERLGLSVKAVEKRMSIALQIFYDKLKNK